MIEKLEGNPHETFEFNDDEAELLLFKLGIVDRFTRKPSPEEATQAVVYREHRTHHILALYYSGQPEKEENGFVALCFPKSKHSQLTFDKMAAKFLNLNSPTVQKVEAFGGPPLRN